MIDSSQGTRPSDPRGRARRAYAVLLALGLGAVGCDATTPEPDLPFARSGSVRVDIIQIKPTDGFLQQSILWSSDGRWQFTEGIYYRDGLGDQTVRRSTEDAGTLAQRYANWIAGVNDSSAIQLFDRPDLPASAVPVCSTLARQTKVTVTLVDAQRGDSIAWTRCAEGGSLATLSPENAGLDLASGKSDVAAPRVIEAARRLRDATLPFDRSFKADGYAYETSHVFRTLDRGELTKSPLVLPRVITDAAGMATFWNEFMPSSRPLPQVDFANEVVLVAAIGVRQEAGDSVEVRRIQTVDFGTQVSVYESRLGDFCTPAPRTHTPFHIVAAPRDDLTKTPIFFVVANEAKPDFVPCG